MAGLAGISRSALWAYESGERDLHRMATIDALADALSVSQAWLPRTSPRSREGAAGHDHAERIRLALVECELGTQGAEPRPLPALARLADQAHESHLAGNVIDAARHVPHLLTELRTWTETGTEQGQATALRATVIACAAACSVTKWLGFVDLAWSCAMWGRQAARRLDDPLHLGLADVFCSHVLTPYSHALANSERAIAEMQPHVGGDLRAMQVYGMLHLMAAFGGGVTGQADGVRAHLHEAADLARRTGERTDFALYFGPTNVDIWRVAIAVEQGEGGRAAEVARRTNVRAMPSIGRQANFYISLGRGFAQERRDDQALTAFTTAERLAPEQVHRSPLVRHATQHMLRRATRNAVGCDLRAFATQGGCHATPGLGPMSRRLPWREVTPRTPRRRGDDHGG